MAMIQARLQEASIKKVVAMIAEAGFVIEAEDGGYVVTEKAECKVARRSLPMTTFRTWLQMVKAAGEQAIPPGDEVFEYAHRVGLPVDILQLHWLEFRRRYGESAKRYKNWRLVFRKSVEGNWFSLWRLYADGGYTLGTAGLQAQRDHRARGEDGTHA